MRNSCTTHYNRQKNNAVIYYITYPNAILIPSDVKQSISIVVLLKHKKIRYKRRKKYIRINTSRYTIKITWLWDFLVGVEIKISSASALFVEFNQFFSKLWFRIKLLNVLCIQNTKHSNLAENDDSWSTSKKYRARQLYSIRYKKYTIIQRAIETSERRTVYSDCERKVLQLLICLFLLWFG